MNDLILADRELEVGFIGQLDALFFSSLAMRYHYALIEKRTYSQSHHSPPCRVRSSARKYAAQRCGGHLLRPAR